MIGAAVVPYLESYPGLAELVGDRIYPGRIPQNETKPAIAYRQISGRAEAALTGPSGLLSPRLQFSCYALDHDQAVRCRDLVRQALHGFRGPLSGVTITGVDHLGEADLPFDPSTEQFGTTVDLRIWHHVPNG